MKDEIDKKQERVTTLYHQLTTAFQCCFPSVGSSDFYPDVQIGTTYPTGYPIGASACPDTCDPYGGPAGTTIIQRRLADPRDEDTPYWGLEVSPAPQEKCWSSCRAVLGEKCPAFCDARPGGSCCRQGNYKNSEACGFGSGGCDGYHCCTYPTPSPPPPIPPRAPSSCESPQTFIPLSFSGSVLKTSNLGGLGGEIDGKDTPTSGTQEIYIKDVAVQNGVPIALRIVNKTEYRAANAALNGLKQRDGGTIGVVNLRAPEEGDGHPPTGDCATWCDSHQSPWYRLCDGTE